MCFRKIKEELKTNIDKHIVSLIVSNIELLLNYCLQFYDRQFITRAHVNKDVLTRFEALLKLTINLNYRRLKAYHNVIPCIRIKPVSKLFWRFGQEGDG